MKQVDLVQLLYAIKDHGIRNEEVLFFGNCIARLNDTKSQNFQDIWALYENKFQENGFFVEFGATNGVDGSNSYLLQKSYNWRGILAEPNPIWHDALTTNRSDANVQIEKDCIYTETGKTLDFLAVDEPDLSTLKGFGTDDEHTKKRESNETITVNTISLYDLLVKHNAPKQIDYLSIDTEGSEYDILEAFFSNPGDYSFKCVTVEHNFNEENRTKIFNLLFSKGYVRKFTGFSRWDDFYVRETND